VVFQANIPPLGFTTYFVKETEVAKGIGDFLTEFVFSLHARGVEQGGFCRVFGSSALGQGRHSDLWWTERIYR